MIQRHANKLIVSMILVVAAVIGVTLFTGHSNAQLPPLRQTPQAANNAPQPALEVGTYNANAAFDKHPARQEVLKAFQTAQAQIQQAQEQGDQEQLQAVQQQYEKQREQIIEAFQQDVNKALPAAAQAAGVKVVALQVVYTDDDVAVRDVTPQLVNALSAETEQQQNALPPAPPQMPSQSR